MPDNMDDLIHDAFAEFDAAERAAHVAVPGVATVRNTIAHRRRVRVAALSMIGALLIVIPIAAYAAGPRGDEPLPGGSEPASPSAPAPSAQPSNSAAQPSSPAAPPDLRNVTLDLPAFPGFESACKAKGTQKFVNGKLTRGGTDLVIGELAPIMADLDGVPGDEALTTIRCQNDGSLNVTQLIALKVGPGGGLTALGYVVNSPDTPNVLAKFTRDNITVDNGVVRLTVGGAYATNGWPPCIRQIRGYAWRNGAFRQVSGPTSFPTPSKDFHQLDFRNTGLLVGVNKADGSGRVYCVLMVNGTGEAEVEKLNDPDGDLVRYTFTIGPVSFVNAADGEATFAILTMKSPSGETFQTLQSFQHDGDYPLGWEVLRAGVNGVTAIKKAEVSGDLVRVTVTTSSGATQLWSYKPSATNQSWQRVG
jgi:hypothetical protein